MWDDLDLLHNLLEIKSLNSRLNELLDKQTRLMNRQSELKKSVLDREDQITSAIGQKRNNIGNTKITFIRHAESEFNVIEENKSNKNNSAQSKSLINCGITELGKKQSSKLEFEFDLVILSPLKRCAQTLEYSNIKYKQLIVMDIFREYKTDICDFMKDEEIIYEKEQDIINRVDTSKDILKYIVYNENDIKSIGIVSHFDFIWYFTAEQIENERFGTGLNNAEFVTIVANKLWS